MATRPGQKLGLVDPRQVKQQIKQKAVKEVARRELLRRGQLQKPKETFKGNFKQDFGSFAKGTLMLGRQAITHPIDSSKRVLGVGLEASKLIPGALNNASSQIKQLVTNPIEFNKKGIQSVKNMKNISFDDQQKATDELLRRSQSIQNPNQRVLAQIAAGMLGSNAQLVSHPGQTFYKRPFTTTLDALSVGAGKVVSPVVSKSASVASKTNTGAAIANKVSDLSATFKPQGRLRNAGYGDVADSMVNTTSKVRKSQEGIIRSTVDQFKSLNNQERKAFFEAIDSQRRNPGVRPTSANPKVQVAIDRYLDVELPRIRKVAGYKEGEAPIENYLHHYFTPENAPVSRVNDLTVPKRGFLEQSKDVEGFSKDPVTSIAAVKTKAATANIKEDFAKGVFQKHGVPDEYVRTFDSGKAIDTRTGQELTKYKKYHLPKDLGDELLRIEQRNETFQTLVTPFRVFNRNWKPLATAVRPRYHLRNIVGNLYNTIFVGGMNPKNLPVAAFQQMKNHIATQMKEGTMAGSVYKSIFKNPPENHYYKMALEDDIIGRGFFGADINDLADIADNFNDIQKQISRLENPAEIFRVPVLKQYLTMSIGIGSAFEDNAKLALYIDRIRKGASRVEAKQYVNKHLFDYIDGLGEADKVIKNFIPFWSWTRFNLPLQLQSIYKMPARHLAIQQGTSPLVQSEEANNPEYKYLSQREKDAGAVKIGETETNGKKYDRYMRTQDVLPIADVNKLADYASGDLSGLTSNPLVGIANQARFYMNPPQNPNENLDYFGRPVESYEGESKRFLNMPVRGTTKEILSAIPALTELNKVIGGSYAPEDRPDADERYRLALSPTSEFLADREKNREYFTKDFQNKVTGDYAPGYATEFQMLTKRLIEKPNDKIIQQNRKRLSELLMESGYSEEDIKILTSKAIQSLAKKEMPQPKRGSQTRNRPSRRVKPDVDYSLIKQYLDSKNTKPFYSN